MTQDPKIEVGQAVLNQKIIETNGAVLRIEQDIREYREEQQLLDRRVTTIEAKFDPKLGNRVTVVEGVVGRTSKILWAIVLLILGGFVTAVMNGVFV